MKKYILAIIAVILVSGTDCTAVGKKLKAREMEQLNLMLTIKPRGTYRIMATQQEAIKTNNMIAELKTKKFTKQEELVFVTACLNNLLTPIKEFFDTIRENKVIGLPVIRESLYTPEKTQEPLLLRYMNTNENTTTFFEKEITSLDTLQSACNEFITLVNDVWANMNKDAKKAYITLLNSKKPQQK